MNLSRRNSRSLAERGQIMAEACIGLSLMGLTFILVIYVTYLGMNHLKTLSAARHASWLLGEKGGSVGAADLAAVKSKIDSGFGFDPELTQLTLLPPEGKLGFLAPMDSVGTEMAATGSGPYKVRVTFGLTSEEAKKTGKFPFNLMNVNFPFMGDTRVDLTQVSSECQWDEIGNTWTSPGAALKGIFAMLGGLKDKLSSL